MIIAADTPRPAVGQTWMKRDTGLVVELMARKRNDYFLYKKLNKGHCGHSVSARDLQRFYRKV